MKRPGGGYQPTGGGPKPANPPSGPGGVSAPVNKAEELREVIREANEVLRDIKQERKLLKELIDSVAPDVRAMILERVETELAAFSETVEKKVDESTDKIARRFDTLERLLLGLPGNVKRPALEEVVESYRERNKI